MLGSKNISKGSAFFHINLYWEANCPSEQLNGYLWTPELSCKNVDLRGSFFDGLYIILVHHHLTKIPKDIGGGPPRFEGGPPPQCLAFIGINTFDQFHPPPNQRLMRDATGLRNKCRLHLGGYVPLMVVLVIASCLQYSATPKT